MFAGLIPSPVQIWEVPAMIETSAISKRYGSLTAVLAGSSDLIAIRGRGTSNRPFTKLRLAADDKVMISPRQKELENFLKRKLAIRRELRDVRRQPDADIDALGARLQFINIALVPAVLTLGALGIIGWKTSKKAS